MGAGFLGTWVIPWSQTEIDGLFAAPQHVLTVGSGWRWVGEALRLDGPTELLRLEGAEGSADMRQHISRKVHRLVGAATDPDISWEDNLDEPILDCGFVVTDGAHSYTITEIDAGTGAQPLLMFVNDMPPANTDLWVVRVFQGAPPVQHQNDMPGGVICFTTGTRIETPNGPLRVEELREGSKICTLDNGPQEIHWIGRRKMSGARLHAMPHLRPVRFRAGSLGDERPEGDLIVSPQHRVLIRGVAAEMLFHSDEVLVAAEDLINDRSIVVDYMLPEVTYIHLMLEAHQIVWANGVETESFHPANASMDTLNPEQRDRLLEFFPSLSLDPHSYGGFARRNLTRPEAAILQYNGQTRH